jgi:bifunctional DNase/RNase
MPEESHEEPGSFETPPSFFPYDDFDPMVEKEGSQGEPVAVRVEGVYVAQSGSEVLRFVLLTDGARKLSIVIGEAETHAIALPLEGKTPQRPMTHDLLAAFVERLGAKVEKVFIDDLFGSTYYAKIFVNHAGEDMTIDSRPSDAIALAVRLGTPIYVADQILEHAAR